jgi:hypothetical protein
VREPLLAVLHAAHRTEIQELHVLQNMLSARFSSELARTALDNSGGCVSERITRKLAYTMPPADLVDACVVLHVLMQLSD